MDDRIPQWNLCSIYPSPSSDAFNDDILRLGRIGDDLRKAASDGASCMELIGIRDEGLAIAVNLTAYASALLSTDSSSAQYLKAVAASERAEAEFSKAEDAFLRAFPDECNGCEREFDFLFSVTLDYNSLCVNGGACRDAIEIDVIQLFLVDNNLKTLQ